MFFKKKDPQPIVDLLPVPPDRLKVLVKMPGQPRPVRLGVRKLGPTGLFFSNATDERLARDGDKVDVSIEFIFHTNRVNPFFSPLQAKGTVGRANLVKHGTQFEAEIRFDKLSNGDRNKITRFLHRMMDMAQFGHQEGGYNLS